MLTCCEELVNIELKCINKYFKSKFSWKSVNRLSQFRRYNISNGSRRGKVLSEACFFSAGSRPDIRSRNTGRAITIYFSSALLSGIHIMLKTY